MTKKENTDGQSRRRRSVNSVADWVGVDIDLLQQVIATITATGGAVRFGYTRDGGAYSVGIYGDGKPFTEFCPADADVEGWIKGIIDDYR